MKKHLFIANIFIYSFLSVVLFLFVSVIRVNASSYPLTLNDFGTVSSYDGSDLVGNFDFIEMNFYNSKYFGRLGIGSYNQNISSLYVRLKEVPLPYRYSRFFFVFRSSQVDVIPANVIVNDTYTYPITCSNYVNQHSQESTIKTFLLKFVKTLAILRIKSFLSYVPIKPICSNFIYPFFIYNFI